MKPKMILKIITDMAMTVALLLLMTYSLIGEDVHEWVGVAIFILFILHHILNSRWSGNVLKGKYTAMRTLQTILVALILIFMIGSMFSGIILSRYVFSFISVKGLYSVAHKTHMISAYWGFVLMALHLGIHWNMIMSMTGKFIKNSSSFWAWILRIVGILIAGYGIYAFWHRGIGRYMLMLDHFVFFDFDEPLVLFMIDYMAIMGLFVFAGHYISKGLKYIRKK